MGQLGFPQWLEVTAALVLMDYAFYVWHVLMHRVPFLWRMHLVHHVDLDLDASTALRFHFTEMLASIPWRAGQVVLIGLTPFSFSVWQCLFVLCILFHYSNIELPIRLERWLNKIIVTPRMHGIHHSIVERETNANWSSGLTVWDWLHETLRLNVPQVQITIGVPAFRSRRRCHKFLRYPLNTFRQVGSFRVVVRRHVISQKRRRLFSYPDSIECGGTVGPSASVARRCSRGLE